MDDASRSRAKKINAMEARRNFGTNLEMVYYSGAQFVIERAGKPMAALVPISLLEEWQKQAGPAKTGHDTGKGNKRQSKKRGD
jgi:prevent-host-death family protein